MLVGRPCCLEKGIARLIKGGIVSDRLLVIGRERMIASIRPSRLGHFLFDSSPLLPISIETAVTLREALGALSVSAALGVEENQRSVILESLGQLLMSENINSFMFEGIVKSSNRRNKF